MFVLDLNSSQSTAADNKRIRAISIMTDGEYETVRVASVFQNVFLFFDSMLICARPLDKRNMDLPLELHSSHAPKIGQAQSPL